MREVPLSSFHYGTLTHNGYLCHMIPQSFKSPKPYRSILRLAAPIMIAQIGAIITGYADTIMVGHYTTLALASASWVNNMFNLITITILGFSYGITPLVGALHARGDSWGSGEMLRNAAVANGAFGLVMIAIWGVIYLNIDHMGVPVELLPMVRPYYLTILWSMFPLVVINVLRQFTDALTHTSVGMWILTCGNGLNIAGNYALIFGNWGFPELGLYGAGISTLVSRMIMAAAFVAVIALNRRYHKQAGGFAHGTTRKADVLRVSRISLPVALQMGMETGIFTVAALMVARLGSNSLAAYQVLVMLGSIGFMVYYAIGAATSIKIAGCCGNGNIGQVRAASQAGHTITIIMATVAGMVFVGLGQRLLWVFTSDAEVRAIAMSAMWILAAYQLGDATQVAYSNSLRGIGKTSPVMRIAFVSYVAVGIPLLYVLAFAAGWGIQGIYAGFVVSLFTAGELFRRSFNKSLGTMWEQKTWETTAL